MPNEPILTYAAGPAGDKQRAFVENEDIPESALLGSMGSGKTRAMAMSILFDVVNYPGCKIALMRSESVLLKKSTLETLFSVLKQAGLKEGKEGSSGDFYHYKNDSTIEFYLGGEVSKVYYFGLNTGDYKEKLKSFEPFRAYIDEASEVDEKKVFFSLIRCRQDVYHRLTYKERIAQDISQGRLKTFEEGFERYRITEEQLNAHARGRNLIKYVANDEGNNWMWNRLVNVNGDKPHPNSDEMNPQAFVAWVHKNVGVTEFKILPHEVPIIRTGDIVETEEGRTAEVMSIKGEIATLNLGGTVHKVPRSTLTLVLERLCIYIFSLENHSLSEDNIQNFYYADEDTRNQYLHGLVNIKSGKMFPEFNVDTHVVPSESIPEHWFIWVGIDYNIDVACASFIAESPLGDLVVFDELEGFSGNALVNAQEIIAKINHPWSRVKVYYDPSMDRRDPSNPSKSVAQLYRDAGLHGIKPANNAREYGIGVVKELLRVKKEPGYAPKPGLWVMDNCTVTINGSDHNRGLLNTEWEEWRLKKMDHLCLSGDTEIQTVNGSKPIKDVRVGDRVWSPTGFERVSVAGLTDEAATTYEVEFSDGRKLVGTGNHPIWTKERGWMRLDTLEHGMVVSCLEKQPSTKISRSIVTRKAKEILTRGISVLGKRKQSMGRDIFTGWFTRCALETSRRVGTFITKTMTSAITKSKTLNVSARKSIWRGTPRIIVGAAPRFLLSHGRSIVNTCSAFKNWLRNGTQVRRGMSGILITGVTALKKHLLSGTTNANSAVSITHPMSPLLPVRGFAAMLVSPHGDERLASITKRDCVRGVVKSSSQTSIPSKGSADVSVLNVRELTSKMPVYNLSVENSHAFFANGVLVHNCDALRYALASRATRKPRNPFNEAESTRPRARPPVWSRV